MESKEVRIFRFNAADMQREHIRPPQNLFPGNGALIECSSALCAAEKG
jgi:hypothetical protein